LGNNTLQGIETPSYRGLSQKWARFCSSTRLLFLVGLIAGSLCLVFMAEVSWQSGEDLQEASRAASHTREVLEKLSSISSRLSEVESAARSFAISGKQSHLNPFYIAAKAAPAELEQLKRLLRGNTRDLQTLVKIEPTINRHIKVMKDMVELGKPGLFGGSGQRGLTDQANMLMEQIQTSLDTLEKSQRARLDQEQALVSARAERVTSMSLAGSVLAGVLIVAFGVWALRAMHRQAKAEVKLDRFLGSMPDALVIVNMEGKIITSNAHTAKMFGYSERELAGESMALLVPERFRQNQRQYYAGFFSQRSSNIPETTIEICGLHKEGWEFPIEISTKPLVAEKGLLVTSAIRDLTERKRAEKQIFELNQELESRAVELESANKELEAFSYSVSHDLRSPLQNIDSFSQILMEDYANRLDTDGRDYVQRLRASCQHMEQIIDALLALSNMTRHELVVDKFDLSALARTVAAEVKQADPDRLVDWVIAEGLTVNGDAQLLRVVFENLFGNAWKFTAKRPRARIEFGALPQSNGFRTYFVRDDGAGFDMTRANQLFTPFKRLHDQSQFRGTGIGLATVQRVIQRHRGKIWAEGVVEQGATFCFTLSEETNGTNGHDERSNKSN